MLAIKFQYAPVVKLRITVLATYAHSYKAFYQDGHKIKKLIIQMTSILAIMIKLVMVSKCFKGLRCALGNFY